MTNAVKHLPRWLRTFGGIIFFLLGPLWFAFSPVLHAESNEEKLSRLQMEEQLARVERKLQTVSENQKKLKDQYAQVKAELDRLGIWMRR